MCSIALCAGKGEEEKGSTGWRVQWSDEGIYGWRETIVKDFLALIFCPFMLIFVQRIFFCWHSWHLGVARQLPHELPLTKCRGHMKHHLGLTPIIFRIRSRILTSKLNSFVDDIYMGTACIIYYQCCKSTYKAPWKLST